MREASTYRTPFLVLVVAEDANPRQQAARALEPLGALAVGAANGIEAIDLCESQQPDLVLLECQRPGDDTEQTCSLLRGRLGPDLPILVVSSAADRASYETAFDAGASDFLSQPVDWTLLGLRVQYLLRASRGLGELRRSQESLAAAQRIARLGSWQWAVELGEGEWSEEAYRILGYLPGRTLPTLEAILARVHPEERDWVRRQIEEACHECKGFQLEHRIAVLDEERHVRQEGEAWRTREGTVIHAVIQDVTEQRQTQERMRWLANFDALTGLSNRHHFSGRLGEAIERARRTGRPLALFFLDLDRFKRINDSLGHSAGDALLKTVAERILRHVRASDSVSRLEPEDEDSQLSRLGGDEFTLVLPNIHSSEGAERVARRILRSLPPPIRVDGHDVSVTASLGISIYPFDGNDVDTLVRNADTAMYHAKARGGNTFQFFSSSMNAAAMRKLSLETRLGEALEREELLLHFQPKCTLSDGVASGVEALLRWRHPEIGMVSPAEFVPIAEESGLIVPIGAWVLERACHQLAAWQRAGLPVRVVSVNVSGRQLGDAFLSHLGNVIAVTRIQPSSLELEITETAMMESEEESASILTRARQMGVRVALDDFGTGYSSLSYLKRFPLDTLKIDRSFVRDLPGEPEARGIAEAIVAMARVLSLRTVAEGVEQPEQREFLSRVGCDELQGFLYARPMTAKDLEKWLIRQTKGDRGARG